VTTHARTQTIGTDARRLLVLIAQHEHENRDDPVRWRPLFRQLGLHMEKGSRRMLALRERGYVTFEVGQLGTTKVTKLGLQAAASGLHQLAPKPVEKKSAEGWTSVVAKSKLDSVVQMDNERELTGDAKEATMATNHHTSTDPAALRKAFMSALRKELRGVKVEPHPSYDKLTHDGTTVGFLKYKRALAIDVRDKGKYVKIAIPDEKAIPSVVKRLKARAKS
jgi:hypothetical protein